MPLPVLERRGDPFSGAEHGLHGEKGDDKTHQCLLPQTRGRQDGPVIDQHRAPEGNTGRLLISGTDFSSVEITQGTKVCLGQAMKELGFTHTAAKNVPHYKVIPLKVA